MDADVKLRNTAVRLINKEEVSILTELLDAGEGYLLRGTYANEIEWSASRFILPYFAGCEQVLRDAEWQRILTFGFLDPVSSSFGYGMTERGHLGEGAKRHY